MIEKVNQETGSCPLQSSVSPLHIVMNGKRKLFISPSMVLINMHFSIHASAFFYLINAE